ncbi:MAG: hypothetical protein KDB02_16195 [Acidimicrobiales bacterium]|nr:hypothetical protein [Acidimicrobiales bacterium]
MTKPGRDRWIYVGVVALSLVVFLTGAITWLTRDSDSTSRDGAGSEAPTRDLAPAPFAVTLTVSTTSGSALLGAPVHTVVEAAGKVREVALWDGGVRFASSPVRGEGGRAEFRWTPLRSGPHLLQARATDGEGRTALSAPVSVSVRRPLVTSGRIVVPAADGMNAETVASMAGIDPSDVGVGPAGDTGESTFVLDLAALDNGPGRAGPIVENSSPADGSPSLTASADGCDVGLTATGLDGEATVYEASGTGGGSVQVATIDGEHRTTLPNLGPGTHVFSLSVDGKNVVGPPAAVTLGPACKQSWWEGNASIVDGVLRIPEAAPNLYLYLGVDDEPFIRVPQVPGTFLPSSTHVDVAPYLPHLEGSALRVEVWSGSDPARKVASATAKLPAGTSVPDLIGESTRTVLVSPSSKVAPNADEVTFHWATGNAHATGVWWQVLAYRVGAEDQTLSPPGLIAAGIAPVGDLPPGLFDGAAAGGTFTISPSTLLGTTNTGPKVTYGDLGVVMPVVTRLTDLVDGTDPGPDPAGLPIIGEPRVYVRVLPMHDGQPLGAASPPLRLSKPHPTQPPTAAFDLVKADFDAGRAANPALSGCVRVTEVPWTSEQAVSLLSPDPDEVPANWQFVAPFYRVPGTYCYNDFEHGSTDDDCDLGILCDVGETIGGAVSTASDLLEEVVAPAWDFIATTYNGLIDLAATALSKLNPLCLQAGAAAKATGSSAVSDAADTCEQLSKVAAKAAIAAVLTSFGIPPSLPTSSQLAAIAEGRIADLGVEVLKSLGVPCDDLNVTPEEAAAARAAGADVPADGVDACRLFVEKSLTVVQQQAALDAQTKVGMAAGLPYPPVLIDGFAMQLEPRQFPEPPSLYVEARPQQAQLSPLSVCPVTFDLVGPAGPVSGSIARWSQSLTDPWGSGSKPVGFGDAVESDGSTVELSGWAAALQVPGSDAAGEAQVLNGLMSSKDCLAGTPTELGGTVAPPLGRWAPGQPD